MTDQVRDRQDAQVWTQIEAKNFKQALKIVDKRLAKKKTDYLEALKIYIRAQSSQVAEKTAVVSHLQELAKRKPPLTDWDAIDLYDEALDTVLPEDLDTWSKTVGELRWQSVKFAPKIEKSSLKCFQACLTKDDLDHARHIANSLEKSFPENRSYTLWSITALYLYSTSSKCPETQRNIWNGLSLAQITKLATITRDNTDPKHLPSRSIQTPQEILLLHRITKASGKTEQLNVYLEDPNLGPESAIAKGEWELWRLRLKALEQSQRWPELFEITSNLLERARKKNTKNQLLESKLSDWVVWEGFIRSAIELQDYAYISKVEAEIEAHLDPLSGIDKSWRRNASLALVKLGCQTKSSFSSQDNHSFDQVQGILKYLEEFGDANTAYHDVRHYVEQLSQDERSVLSDSLESSAPFGTSSMPSTQEGKSTALSKIAQSVNKHKLLYLLNCVLPELERRTIEGPKQNENTNTASLYSEYDLGKLATQAIQVYRSAGQYDEDINQNLASTDRHPADDLCVLAAMCLIKLGLQKAVKQDEGLSAQTQAHVLRATALLEYASSKSKSNFQIHLLLIRLYTYLGCCSLAFRAYQRLALKQIQLDTLSYTFFDRLSSIHPHNFSQLPEGCPETQGHLDHLAKQQRFYLHAKDQITNNIWLSFKHGNYNSIFEMIEVSDKLSSSMSATMAFVESRKILRLTDPGKLGQLDVIPSDVETLLCDTNDYSSFPNFESSMGSTFEELTRILPAPSDCRYRTDVLAEMVMLLIDQNPREPAITQVVLERISHFLENQKTIPATDNISILSSSEIQSNKLFFNLAQLLCNLNNVTKAVKPDDQENASASVKAIVTSIEGHIAILDKLQNIVPASQAVLHAVYVAFEASKTALNLAAYLNKLPRDQAGKQAENKAKLATVAQDLLKIILKKTAAIKEGMNEDGLIDKVIESVLPEPKDDPEESEWAVQIIEALRDEIADPFMEEWAGEVVGSWRESVAGFALVKPTY